MRALEEFTVFENKTILLKTIMGTEKAIRSGTACSTNKKMHQLYPFVFDTVLVPNLSYLASVQ
jgi:hypothetical protein